MPPLTMSLSCTTPRTSHPSATTRGVEPEREISSTAWLTASGNLPPNCATYARMESAAPLRMLRTGATTARAALPGSLEPDKTGAVTTAVASLAETPAADETAPGGVGPGRFPPWSSDFQILGPL